MTVPHGHSPVQGQSTIPEDWHDGLTQLREQITAQVAATSASVVFIATRKVGRRPATATGMFGGAQFADAASRYLQSIELPWLVIYVHGEKCFVVIKLPVMRQALADQ